MWTRLADVFPSMAPGGRVGAIDCGQDVELCKRQGLFSQLTSLESSVGSVSRTIANMYISLAPIPFPVPFSFPLPWLLVNMLVSRLPFRSLPLSLSGRCIISVHLVHRCPSWTPTCVPKHKIPILPGHALLDHTTTYHPMLVHRTPSQYTKLLGA